jgi:hypothetical protein
MLDTSSEDATFATFLIQVNKWGVASEYLKAHPERIRE